MSVPAFGPKWKTENLAMWCSRTHESYVLECELQQHNVRFFLMSLNSEISGTDNPKLLFLYITRMKDHLGK